jgi:hypothetical protein
MGPILRAGRWFIAPALALGIAASAAAADDPLIKARQLYNQRQFQAAVEAAEQARLVAARADAADLIAARAYLERFRDSAASDDLTNARERLRRLNPERFGPRERIEYIVVLGEALYFDNAFGAAVQVFESVLQSGDLSPGSARERVLDWWATALDRDTRPRPEIDRQMIYQRMRDRLEEELALHPGSSVASYWLAAAARAQGDLQGAWDAAQAGWVRAPLTADRGAELRADLDRLVTRAIAPERAKVLAQPADTVRADWERFKNRWEK